MAVVWAVACLFCSALNDLLFKCYARKPRSNGYFVSIVGIIWMITGLCFVRSFSVDWKATLFWGIISGIFSVGGNLLMLTAMRTLDAGICSTIYRLNMVPAVLGAAVLLGEKIALTDYIGIFCALLAVIGFIPKTQPGAARKVALTGFILMITASLMRAGMGLSYSYGFAHHADRNLVVVINSLFWIFGGVIFALFEPGVKQQPDEHPLKKLWLYGFGSGICVAAIVITMALALSLGKASVVLPIMQMSFILTGILGVLILKEKMTPLKIAAVLCGAAAVLILGL